MINDKNLHPKMTYKGIRNTVQNDLLVRSPFIYFVNFLLDFLACGQHLVLARDPSSCPDLSSTDIVTVQSSSGENIQHRKYWKCTFNRPVQRNRISGNKGVTQSAKLKVILAERNIVMLTCCCPRRRCVCNLWVTWEWIRA